MPVISSPHKRRVRVPFPEMPTPTTTQLSPDEQIAADDSFSVYLKPVELYNVLRTRAQKNPMFLQRCLSYKLEAKRKERIRMSISLCRAANGGQQVQTCIVLGKRVSDPSIPEDIAMYRFKRACVLKELNGHEAAASTYANFLLPKTNKLAMEAKGGSYYLLIITNAESQNSHGSLDHIADCHLDASSISLSGGRFCLLGKISLESLFHSLERSPNLSLWEGVDLTTTIDLCSYTVKINDLKKDKFVAVQASQNPENMMTKTEQVQLSISLEELGAKEKSLYNSYSCENRSSALSHIIRLRVGNVIFNYRYYSNKLQRTEVTEDFSCPFCLVKCGSFKGLQQHLWSSHELFNFEFWVTENFQAVNVSVKADIWRYESLGYGVDPRQQIFSLCLKRLRHKRLKGQNGKHVYPLELDLLPRGLDALMDKAEASTSMPQSYLDPDCIPSVSGNNLVPVQLAKAKKQPVEPSDPRNCPLLQRRKFFHSQRAQPMALEQVFDDYDSEDDVDNDVADFEDRKMLDDFVDVTKDEKQIMHMWNSFVRKQRVLADGHIPWACEAFSKLHGPEFVRLPGLKWCWRVLMIKLWNHGLLDGRSMTNCNTIIEQYHNQDINSDKTSK